MLCLNLRCGDMKEEKKREIGKENELKTAKLLFLCAFWYKKMNDIDICQNEHYFFFLISNRD